MTKQKMPDKQPEEIAICIAMACLSFLLGITIPRFIVVGGILCALFLVYMCTPPTGWWIRYLSSKIRR